LMDWNLTALGEISIC